MGRTERNTPREAVQSSFHHMKRTVSLPQGFGFCRVPLLLAIAVVINCCGLRYRRVEDGGKMRYFCSLAAHLEYSLQIIEPE